MKHKQTFDLISGVIKEHNEAEWKLARLTKVKPKLLPSLVGVDEILVSGVRTDFDKSQVVTAVVRAKYRVYYTIRKSGEQKPGLHFTLGRPREGLVELQITTVGELRTWWIHFPELKLSKGVKK